MLHWVENGWMEFSGSTGARRLLATAPGGSSSILSPRVNGKVAVLACYFFGCCGGAGGCALLGGTMFFMRM
jgi:hypothetical protein